MLKNKAMRIIAHKKFLKRNFLFSQKLIVMVINVLHHGTKFLSTFFCFE